ncbi:MAG TPA: hypothetical protein VKG02_09670, partial [Blastocatellia bacterium]|nr:hypothetical protein [Blastocatellia bacterium]
SRKNPGVSTSIPMKMAAIINHTIQAYDISSGCPRNGCIAVVATNDFAHMLCQAFVRRNFEVNSDHP